MMLSKKTFILFFITLNIICCIVCQRNYTNVYYMKNHVLGLSEELKVDSIEEDKYFAGGKDVKHWLKLPSVSVFYLIGIKEKGLSLITISKKVSTPSYQAVERQLDVGDNITSTIAFKSFNYELQKMEDLVIISTNSEKNEIILYKIQNYKLNKFWVWKRYAKVQSLHQFTVMREDRLLLLDSDGFTGYLYKFSIDRNSVHIRELEVINFSEPTSRISVSILFPEPYMYVVQDGKLAVYRYIRFCPESWIGEFIKQTTFDHLGITDTLPFHSNGREYLAIAGKLGGILRVDASDKFVQELQIDNVIEWLVIHTGPEKENTLLLCKTAETIYIFYNSGFGWKTQVNPSCYKFDETSNKRIITSTNLGCLQEKKWTGAVSLDFGQLPTLIFGERKFIGEMYHIMLSIKRHILSMEELNDDNKDYGNYLSKVRSNLKDLVGVMNTTKEMESTCSIMGMLSEIENIAAKAKEKVSNSCPAQSPVPNQRISSLNQPNKNGTKKEITENKPKTMAVIEDESEDIRSISSKLLKTPMHMISPDMEDQNIRYQDLGMDISMAGISKKQENII